MADPIVDGQVLAVGTPEHDAWLLGRLQLALAAAGSTGAPVAVLDIPCYEAVDGQFTMRAERDDPASIAQERAPCRRPPRQPARRSCNPVGLRLPGRHAAAADGEALHGVHYSAAGVHDLWKWLTPVLRQIVSSRSAQGAP